ncbi:MAG: HesA/MoeB/ThiF family protein [Terriglobia bacterium]
MDELIKEARGKEQAIVKVHSHVGDFRKFSPLDDNSDRSLFESVASLLEDGLCHASLIMLTSGEIFGRVVENGAIGDGLSSVMVVGDDLKIWTGNRTREPETFTVRQAQAFGQGTTGKLRSLAVAIVGCSGTGSIVAEQLARLGVGKLVLVDPDIIEERNLNRILNSGKEDAYLNRYKVHAIASAIARMGFGQEVVPLSLNLATRTAVFAVAACDAVFGCMDGVEGRHLLNRLATFYCLPYFDVGVRLDADGLGGVASVAGAVHYLQPGRSSLLSRGLYTMAQVEAEEMRRMNPELYARHRDEGYLRGIVEERPAVITVNMFFASLAVNEFLARLHPYRNRPNSDYAYVGGNLAEVALLSEPEGPECAILKHRVGTGDVEPLLERSILS